MHISGLNLGAWITVYMGFMLVRSGGPVFKAGGAPSDSRRIFSYIGYGLLACGVVVFLYALRIK